MNGAPDLTTLDLRGLARIYRLDVDESPALSTLIFDDLEYVCSVGIDPDHDLAQPVVDALLGKIPQGPDFDALCPRPDVDEDVEATRLNFISSSCL